MERCRSRWATVLLVVASVAFGVLLAGTINWAPVGYGQSSGPGPVTVAPARGALPGFAPLAEAVAPAVVSIRAVAFQEAPTSARGGEGGGTDPFEFFFGPRRRPDGNGGNDGDDDDGGAEPSPSPQPSAPPAEPGRARPGQPGPLGGGAQPSPEEFRSESGGSGFLISADGLIATNYHVIEGATELMVTVGDERREVPAKVRGIDPLTDLALIQIQVPHPVAYLRLGDSAAVRPGDWVMVIGNPLRLGRTVTVGVVSATGRSGLGITDVSFENFLQTDAAINFGNSGGPMVDLEGQVIGIATAINFGAENVGFAVPSSTLAKVLPQLEEHGRVRRGYLGVNIENLDYRAQEAFGLPSEEGALVVQVNEGTPAANAGLEHGDVILHVDGQKVATTRDLIDYVSDRPPGTQVELDVLRAGRRQKQIATVGERPTAAPAPEAPEEHSGSGIDWLGLRYQDLSPAMRSSHGMPEEIEGVWVRGIAPRSPLVDENVEPGDLITEVNGRPMRNVKEFEAFVRAAPRGSYLRFYVQRFDPRSGRSGQFFAFARVP